MFFTIQLFLLYGFAVTISYALKDQPKSLEVDDMTLSWEDQGDSFSFNITSPAKGWIALGLNETNQLTKMYLVMGRSNDSRSEVVAHFVVSPGDYRPFSSIQEKDNLRTHRVLQTGEGNAMTFSIAKKSINAFTKNLVEGQKIFATIAYSHHQDFQHHSAFRKTIKIKL